MTVKHHHKPKVRDSFAHIYKSIERKKLKLVMVITGIVMIIEVIGSVLTNSLALLSDAGHMFTHFFALGIGYVAIIIARKDSCHHRTYGFYRVEILAALFNSLFLFAVTAYIFFEGIKRLISPEPVLGLQVFLVAVVGLTVNAISVLILRGSARDDINTKGVFLHVIADTLSSVVVVFGAIIMYFTGWYIVDPLSSIGISLVIFMWARGLFKDSINVLLETAPKGINIDNVSAELKKEIPEVRDIRDMHIWEITSNMYSLTAHIAINGVNQKKSTEILNRINKFLNERYDIEHTTIQFDI